MSEIFEHRNCIVIPHGKLWVADAYLTYQNNDMRNDVVGVVDSLDKKVHGADFRFLVTKENGTASEVLGLVSNRLDELLADYPEYTIVQRICFTEPYVIKNDSTGKAGIVAIFIGNIAKNPTLSN